MNVAKIDRVAVYGWFAKVLATTQHPDISTKVFSLLKSSSSMNNIELFSKATSFAVAGASQNRSKYGNIVFRAIIASGRIAYPLNPNAVEVEGYPAFDAIADLPVVPESLSIVTPPHVTRLVIQQAIAAGVKNIWMQPGAEDSVGSQAARDAGLNVIDDGSCILVSLSIERSAK